MNQNFDFDVIVQPSSNHPAVLYEINKYPQKDANLAKSLQQTLQLSATGSEESRARRRLLSAIFAADCTALQITCTGSAPV